MTLAKTRKQGLDKFYTKLEVAKECIEHVGRHYEWEEWDLVIEPSAGSGSFLSQIPVECKKGIDIEPDQGTSEKIEKGDFLLYTPEERGRILVIGNPPFGKCSSLAIKFFNHASLWADVIAFIIPRTFRRVSVQNKLNLRFHNIFDIDIPLKPCAFEPAMMAKCCFQIWERKGVSRSKTTYETVHNDWQFLEHGPKDDNNQPTPPQTADFAIRAYGGKCGEIKRTDLHVLRPKSWHWIKAKIPIERLVSNFEALDYSLSQDTARQNSIGRGELVEMYKKMHNQI